MKVLKGIKQLGEYANVKESEALRAYDCYEGLNFILLAGIEYLQHTIEGETHFILLENKSDEECKEYILKYEHHEYNWICFIDEIEGMQHVELLDIENKGMRIIRAKVRTKNGTEVVRIVDYAPIKEEIKDNRNIYFYDKE